MPSEHLDGNSLRKARRAVGARESLDLRDTGSPGLAIRVQRGSAAWYLVTRERKVAIGPLAAFDVSDLPELRSLVARARGLMSEGEDPAPMLKAAVVHRSAIAAEAQASVTHGRGMRWESMRDTYLAWAKEHRAPDTYRTYRSALGATAGSALAPDFAGLVGRPVTLISTQDLRRVRNAILARGHAEGHRDGKRRQASLTVAALKAAFGWAVEHGEVTGLTSNVAHELKPTPPASADHYSDDSRDDEKRALTQPELGSILSALEGSRSYAARLALGLLLMTGQRRMTVVRARRKAFRSHPTYGMLWQIGPDKVGKYRVLPLPDRARAIVEQALAAGRDDNPFLFPQQRPRRRGAPCDGHLSERLLSEVLEDIRAQPGFSAPWVATHDFRRAFVTHMLPRVTGLGLDRTAVPMVTRADEGRYGLDETVYDRDPNLKAKWDMLREWQGLVIGKGAPVTSGQGAEPSSG